MGIDWYCMKVKDGVSRSRLDELIEQQAVAFQSIWGWDSVAYTDNVLHAVSERLHLETYHSSSRSLRDLLEFPDGDEQNGCIIGIPNHRVCWRVYPITNNPTFPPLWRVLANRTLLPDQLAPQLQKWKTWAEQVVNGGHDDYVHELYMYETCSFLYYHWLCLRGAAGASLSETGNWSKNPKFVEVREKILLLPEPLISDIRIDPLEKEPIRPGKLDIKHEDLFEKVKTLLDLSRAWNSNVRGHWKIPYYEGNYYPTFDKFKEQARNSWLQEFFEWADRCVENGFGLYLDY